jgi:hypothetical protein
MTPDQAKEAFYKTTFTLKGRIFHPNLLKVRQKTTPKGTRNVYDVMFAWHAQSPENQATIAQMNQFLQQMVGIIHPGIDPRALVIPVKDFHTYQRQDYKPNPEYLRDCKWVNAESGEEYPPQVVDAQRQPVFNPADVYSGRNAVINFQFYPMLPKADAAPGSKRGFGINLNAVMLLEGGNPEGGVQRTIDVNAVFGAFAQDMGMSGQASQNNFQQQAPAGNGYNAPQGTGQQNSPSQGMNGHSAPQSASPSNPFAQPQTNQGYPGVNNGGNGFI